MKKPMYFALENGICTVRRPCDLPCVKASFPIVEIQANIERLLPQLSHEVVIVYDWDQEGWWLPIKPGHRFAITDQLMDAGRFWGAAAFFLARRRKEHLEIDVLGDMFAIDHNIPATPMTIIRP